MTTIGSLPAELKDRSSDISPAVPLAVIYKLLAFTFAMVTLPLLTYFSTLNHIFKGDSSFAGGAAAVMANVVLFSYIIVAMREDQLEQRTAKSKDEKSQ